MLTMHSSLYYCKYNLQVLNLFQKTFRERGNWGNDRRVSFLFPICLGRSKETMLAG